MEADEEMTRLAEDRLRLIGATKSDEQQNTMELVNQGVVCCHGLHFKLEMLAHLRAGQCDGHHHHTDDDFRGWVKTCF